MREMSAQRTVLYVASTASVLAMFWRPLMRRMAAAGWRVVALTPPGPRWAELNEPGIEHRPVAIARPLAAVVSHARTVGQLYDAYRELRPTLVHHFTTNAVVYGSLAARAAGVPTIVNTLPGLGAVFTSARWDAPALRTWTLAALRMATRLGHSRTVVQNAGDFERLVRSGVIPRDRAILVRGSGVDLDRFRPLPEPEDDATVLFCGRMLRSKGVADLVAAARILHRRGEPCRLLLAGPRDPEHRDAVSVAELDTWQAEGIATWLGMCEDVAPLYAAANVVALPTRYGEGVPSVLAQAAASGRASVATDTAGCREVVRHEHNGLLVPAANVPALAGAIERLLRNRTLRAAMGRRGRELAVTEFSVDRICETIQAIYDALSGHRSQSRAA